MTRRMIVLMLLACLPRVACAAALKIADTPVALAISQVTDRTVRVDILPLDGAGQAKETPPSSVLAGFQTTQMLRVTELPAPRIVQVGTLNLTLKSDPLTISLSDAAGNLVQELTIHEADGSIGFRTETPTFGLGEGRQQFDRRGFFYNFQNGQNLLLATHGTTMPVPFLMGVDASRGGAGWGMFIHNPPPAGTGQPNTAWGQLDLRGDDVPLPAAGRGRGNAAVPLEPPAVLPTRGRFIPRQDMLGAAPTSIYLMKLDTPADALKEYTHLVGNPVMPPKWVMGYMQSHRSLAGAEEVLAEAQKFRTEKLPCDAMIYLGTGYTIATRPNQPFGGWNLGHGSLEFNPLIFPKPQEMIDQLHGLHFKIVLHKNAAPATLHGNSVNDPPDNATHIAAYWATHTPLVKMGVDAWWPDDGDELPIENRLARVKTYYEGPLKDVPNERPWSLDRNGYAGVAKYGGWNWSGDVASRWATLAAHVPVGLQFSLSCSPWWGTDIGGFNGSAEYSGELYTRWFEFGAFCPLFRSHGRNWQLHLPWGWNTGETGPVESTLPAAAGLQAELHNAAVEPACRKALELRYALLPYNYTITREACDTGMPLMRALLLEYPNDATAVSLGDEYLWGPNILVAPVVEKGATNRRVYLPAGTWYDMATGEKFAGKQWVNKTVDLETIPLFMRAGSITPMDPVRQFTAEKVIEPTTLHIYPDADGTFTLYDDDGHSQEYLKGSDPQTQWIRMTWNDAARTLSLDPDPRMKQWPGAARTFKVQLGTDVAGSKTLEFQGRHLELKM